LGQQGGASAKTMTTAEPALQKRFDEYSAALTKKDMAALDKIWAADYSFINPDGALVNKSQRLANIKSGATEFQAINKKSEELRIHGNVAVDVGSVDLQGTKYSGKESSGHYRYMNVWIKEGNEWQLLANQLTLIK